ncbi:MAG: DNA internalization-related competence protein ComEC/Rec2 [Actinobacteria bacterium]|nr:DNA internalization-related competence protein ComEC/Rec2 [Actinomycetota bacterium]
MSGALFIFCLLVLSTGILLGRFAGPALIAATIILPVLLYLYAARAGIDCKRIILIAVLFLACGSIISSFSFQGMRKAVIGAVIEDGSEVRVTGTVKSEPYFTGNRVSFILQCERIETERRQWRSSERLNVMSKADENNSKLFPGIKVTVAGKVLYEKESPDWLEIRGAVAEIDAERGSVSVTGGANLVSRCIEGMSKWLNDGIDSVFGESVAGLVKGYSIGSKTDIDGGTLDDLDKCGLSHIVAVSGLHIGTTALIITWLVSFAGFSRRSGIITAVIVAILIVSISGFRPSAVRSAIMVFAAFGGVLAGRRFNGYSGLGIAGIAILGLNPRALFDPGFQYSFAAVLGILTVIGKLPPYTFPKRLTAVWAGAQAGLLPVLIAHSKQVPLVSLPANIAVVPFLGPAVLLSILAAGVSHLSVHAGKLIASAPSLYTRFVILISKSFSAFPEAAFSRLLPGISLLIFGFSLYTMVSKLKRGESIMKACILIICALLVLVLPGFFLFGPGGGNRIIFFDVGQGDSILIQDESGKTVLVDGGPESEIIVDKLRINGIRKLDLVILTHPHQDHSAGLVGVLKEFPVGRILVPGVEEELPGSWADFTREAVKNGIIKTVAEAGQCIEISPECKLNVLYPLESTVFHKDDLNNGSIVILCELEGVRTLLMGDLEIEGQKLLMNRDSELDCDVLKVPHQGSRDAASKEFIDCCRPELAVISVGEGNEYGHPSKIFTGMLRSEGVKTFRTDKMGDIVMSIEEDVISVQTGRSGL